MAAICPGSARESESPSADAKTLQGPISALDNGSSCHWPARSLRPATSWSSMKPRSVAPIPSPYPPPADPPLQAAVDVETDAMLQTTLRSNMFKNRTIITIAHRINTILDSDRIIVLSQGQVAEFDTPAELVRKKGLFYELVKEANLLSSLEVAS
jgi:hypothetical protein